MDTLPFWIGFNVFVLIMLALDLGVFHRKRREISVRDALVWTGVWVALAMVFALLVFHIEGHYKAMEFLTGYVIEKSLSLDNIFVIALIFSYFKTPAENQHKILFLGILGALVLRAIFILTGVTLLEKFQWMSYVFGFILIYTGIRIIFKKHSKVNPEKNWVVKVCRKYLPFTAEMGAGEFFKRQNGKIVATPLFLVLIVVETSDVMFAVDSIPAILAVTHDSFIVYTSNVFAILGLRSLYFALAHIIERFTYLQAALSVILIFVGIKMLAEQFLEIPIYVSLIVILGVLGISIVLSLLKRRKLSTSKERE
jgi:tellurite resistance protein TerC